MIRNRKNYGSIGRKSNLFLGIMGLMVCCLILIGAAGDRQKLEVFKGQKVKPENPKSQIKNWVKLDMSLGKIPLYFISNRGQVNKTAKFYAQASHYTLWLTKGGLVFDSIKRGKSKEKGGRFDQGLAARKDKGKYQRDVSRFAFVGANKNPEIKALEQTQLKVNYFKGSDPKKWHGGIPTSKAVLYKNLYKNIDLKVYGIERQIEYDWVVKAGGNAEDICFAYKNIKGTKINEQGDLIISTDFGDLVHQKPYTYQWDDQGKTKVAVESRFKKISKNTYGFEVSQYDQSKELIIDPVILLYSTYLGGNNSDEGHDIAVDNNGYAYITGYTLSSNFPTLNPYQTDQTYSDVFVTKLDTNQSGAACLLYSTYLGGSDSDEAWSIAIDNSGHVYVTGETRSTDFPTLNPYQGDQRYYDVFVTKLDTNQSGTACLVYSTYLGGEGNDCGYGIAVGHNGLAYVTGNTTSTDFPTLNPYQTDQASSDAFVTKLDTSQPGSASLVYSTYLGGSGTDYGKGIVIDNNSYVYVTGYTYSANFPTLNPYQGDQGEGDVFVTKLDTNQPGPTSLLYSTYLGGDNSDIGRDIAVVPGGYAYLTGMTYSTDFPTLNPYQGYQGSDDVFVTKLDTNQSGASSLLYSTYLGGNSFDRVNSIAADKNGHVYVTGYTGSTNFPILNPYQGYQGSCDAFVTKLDTKQSGAACLVYSTYLGGDYYDEGTGIAINNKKYVYVTGHTISNDFPTLNSYQHWRGGIDAFVTKLGFPAIDVQVPNGGEVWVYGHDQIVTWDASCITSNLKISLWKGGSQVGVIGHHVDPLSESYSWTVGHVYQGTVLAGDGYTIKIKEIGSTVTDVSDLPFRIKNSKGLTSPNGDESWQIGSSHNITWLTPAGYSGLLDMTLWKDGVLVGTIASNIDFSLGTYAWTAGSYIGGTAASGSGYRIKIHLQGSNKFDFSNGPFTLTE